MQLTCQHLYSASTNNLYSALLMYLSAHLGLHSLALPARAGIPMVTISMYDLYCSTIPYTREHNDRSFYLKLVAAMGRYIYGVYLFMGQYNTGII